MVLPRKEKGAEMAKKTKPQFAIAVVSRAKLRRLKLPKLFVRDHGEHLSNMAYLQVDNAEDWPVEVVNNKGNLRLRRGWTHFVDHHSVARGYILTFKYDGNSRFRVHIYDTTSSVITYPRIRRNNSRKVPKTKKIKEDKEAAAKDDNTSTEMLDGIKEQFGKPSGGSAEDRLVERVNSFQSEKPFFTAHIKKRNLNCNTGPVIPTNHVRAYFKPSDSDVLLRVNGRNWGVNCYFAKTQRHCISLASGWKKFAFENELREGDICVFELDHLPTKTYDVHMFKSSNPMEGPSSTLIEKGIEDDDIPIPAEEISGERVKHFKCAANAMEKANAFLAGSPGFTLQMDKGYINMNLFVRVPLSHAKEYLRGRGDDDNVIVVHSYGKTWKLEYRYRSEPWLLFTTWRKFRSDNRLKIGNVCAFKMIDVTRKEYQLAIF